jgi:hypothetical protein
MDDDPDARAVQAAILASLASSSAAAPEPARSRSRGEQMVALAGSHASNNEMMRQMEMISRAHQDRITDQQNIAAARRFYGMEPDRDIRRNPSQAFRAFAQTASGRDVTQDQWNTALREMQTEPTGGTGGRYEISTMFGDALRNAGMGGRAQMFSRNVLTPTAQPTLSQRAAPFVYHTPPFQRHGEAPADPPVDRAPFVQITTMGHPLGMLSGDAVVGSVGPIDWSPFVQAGPLFGFREPTHEEDLRNAGPTACPRPISLDDFFDLPDRMIGATTEDKCTVCLEVFEKGQVCKIFHEGDSGHVFHTKCAWKALEVTDSCPTCRKRSAKVNSPVKVEVRAPKRRDTVSQGETKKKVRFNRNT